MSSNLTLLQTALANVSQQLVNMTANPKPNYNIDGQQVSWADLLKTLLDSQKTLQEAISNAEGPWNADTLGIG